MIDLSQISSVDVAMVALTVLILWLMFLIFQLIMTILFFKNKVGDTLSIVDFVLDVIKNIKGKK